MGFSFPILILCAVCTVQHVCCAPTGTLKPRPTGSQCSALASRKISTKEDALDLVFEYFRLTSLPFFFQSSAISDKQLKEVLRRYGLQDALELKPLEYLRRTGLLEGISDRLHLMHVHGLPKYIHMTVENKSEILPLQAASMVSWAVNNPDFSILVYDDRDIRDYIAQYFPNFMPTFSLLANPVEKADAWRYLVLCHHGGVYTDADTICMKGVRAWLPEGTEPPGVIVGIENAFPNDTDAHHFTYARRVQMSQWTMAAHKGNPLLCHMPNFIRAHMTEESQGHIPVSKHDLMVLERTGPGIWTDSLYSYLKQAGVTMDEILEGKRVDEIQILRQTAFGCNIRFWDPANSESLVYHVNLNSWKKDPMGHPTRVVAAGPSLGAQSLPLAVLWLWAAVTLLWTLTSAGPKGRVRRPLSLMTGLRPWKTWIKQ